LRLLRRTALKAVLMTTAIGTATITPSNPPIRAPVGTEIKIQTGFKPVKLPKIREQLSFLALAGQVPQQSIPRKPETSCSATKSSDHDANHVPKGTRAIMPMVKPNSKPNGTFSHKSGNEVQAIQVP